MRVSRPVRLGLLCFVAALVGWFAALWAIPYVASAAVWHVLENNGAVRNRLSPTYLPMAGKDPVPMTNADMITRSAIYDLTDGPVVFEAQVPQNLEYWSVSVFGHNSDTLFVTNDRRAGARAFRLQIRLSDQQQDASADADVISPSRKGFLLVRGVTKDRNDIGDVKKTQSAVSEESLSRWSKTHAQSR